VSREEALKFFGLDPQQATILSIGGSLGAKSINEAIDGGLEKIKKAGLQIIWQTGKPYVEQGSKSAEFYKNVWTGDFIREMDKAFAAADVVISRAGAMAIAELCVVGKPAVFVPYPFASEDHQTVNAQHLVDKKAGIMIRDNEAKEKLVDEVIALARNETEMEILKNNILSLAKKNADEQIARTVLEYIGKA
jgi:UDP-N-acetylglucosamine--N-acetylmuramyl-(pentapeptide) pyrophosphoryl-undecaprenol N-acetylglucosamine transferase